MKCIKIIRDEDFGLESIPFAHPTERLGARGIVLRRDGKIALIYKKNMNEYKLPGGGIDEGENPKIAFGREVLEETGCEINEVQFLGTIVENKTLGNFTQTSYVYVANVKEQTNNFHFTEREIEEGIDLIWVFPREGIKLMEGCIEKLIDSKYENSYHSKFIVLRDITILKYFLKNKDEIFPEE